MSKNRIAALLMFSSLSLLPMPTLAHNSDDIAKPTPAQDFDETERAAIFEEIKAFANAQISVRAAIKIVEERASGAKVVDVSFDGGGGRLAYKVKKYLHEEICDVTIDASTGTTIEAAVVTPVWRWTANTKSSLPVSAWPGSISPMWCLSPRRTAPARQ